MSLKRKFMRDLQFGELYEMKLLEHIPHVKYEKSEGKCKEYDLKIFRKPNRYLRYEVKADKLINKYGNICIEYQCNKQPSGITTSTAHKWAIFEVVDDKYALYLIPKKIILDYIAEKKYKREAQGGDRLASRLYLFDKNLFKDYIIFNNLTNTHLNEN